MRIRLAAILLAVPLVLPAGSNSQQAASSQPQASTLLTQALNALGSSANVSDITLTGTVRRIAGSDDETGTLTLKALSTGEASLAASLPSGTLMEVRSSISNGPAGSWTGFDGTTHEMAMHNCWTDAGWFFPAFSSAFASNQNLQVTYVGQETLDGASVQHVRLNRIVPGDASGTPSAFISHLSQTELYFDPQSLLPIAVMFNTHPDNNGSLDIPIKIKYSDYRSVSGTTIPFHIQKFVQNGLHLDIQIANATLNSGLATSQFQVQ